MLLNLSKHLGINVIAEEVEDEKQSQYLLKNGCNIIQGYLISEPLPVKDALLLLEKYNGKKL